MVMVKTNENSVSTIPGGPLGDIRTTNMMVNGKRLAEEWEHSSVTRKDPHKDEIRTKIVLCGSALHTEHAGSYVSTFVHSKLNLS